MEDVVEHMRKDIEATPVRGDAFSVSYQGEFRRTVQKVTEKLAGMFITESLTDRERLTEGTTEFLERAVRFRAAPPRGAGKEDRGRPRASRQGQLPTQLDANLRALSDTQAQLQQLFEVDNREGDRELTYERSLQDFSSRATPRV